MLKHYMQELTQFLLKKENGRVYQWWYKGSHELKCIRNNHGLLVSDIHRSCNRSVLSERT